MKLKYVFIFLVILVVVFIVLRIPKVEKSAVINSNLPVHEVQFFDGASFTEGISKAEEKFKEPGYKVAGAIVNHHLLASYIIAGLVKSIAVQNPEVVILLGPNHDEKGNFDVLTSQDVWTTKYGKVEPDEKIIKGLIAKNLAKQDEETIFNDHATIGLLPFVKFYMPSTRVVQLLVSKKLTMEGAEKLADALSVYAKDGAIIVASTDFSHYLTAGQANIKDDETLKVINNFDYNKLLSYNSDHLDSPGSVAVFLMTMQKIGNTKQEILSHANSATIQPSQDSYTTSYFSMLYH